MMQAKVTTMTTIDQEAILSLPVVYFPVQEQLSIVRFLDRETAKIDALVDAQKRLIELLKEKRQAVISNAVTKGLDPNAPMKDSGVKWLGQVPKHWKVVAVRHLLSGIEQGWSPECENRQTEAGEWGILKAGCVNGGVFREQEHKTLPTQLEPMLGLEVRAGDLLMSRANGSAENVGAVAYVISVRTRLMLSDKIFRLHAAERVTPRYLAIILSSRPSRAQIENAISGAEGLANNLPQSALKAFRCVVPPLHEQEEILSYLDTRLGGLELLLAECDKMIVLLQERRAALISASATGQIDVRGAAQVEAKAA